MTWCHRWGRAGWVKWVSITDEDTGLVGTGRDWETWEGARQKALDDLLRKLVDQVTLDSGRELRSRPR